MIAHNALIYLPFITTPTILPQPGPCGFVDKAAELAWLIMVGDFQQRTEIRCDQRLIRAAQWRAEAQRDEGWWAHTSPSGETPNALVRRFEFLLPSEYNSKNQVESIGFGFGTAASVLDAFRRSEGHRRHIEGEDWFSRQNRIGVGTCEGGSLGVYWVVLIAREG